MVLPQALSEAQAFQFGHSMTSIGCIASSGLPRAAGPIVGEWRGSTRRTGAT